MEIMRIMPSLKHMLRPRDSVANIFAGFMSGMMTLIASLSYAALIFSGDLASYLDLGISSALVSAVIIGFAVACRSSSSFLIAGPDANISAIMSLMAASIAARIGHDPGDSSLYASLWAAIVLSTVLTGVALYILGRFSMGRWIRFIPYPVVGGFLAGTGWLLVSGSFNVMNGLSLTMANLGELGRPEQIMHWVPGLALALGLTVALRRWKHYLIMPVLLFTCIIAVHAVLYINGIAPAQAAATGWLLTPLPEDLLVHSFRALAPDQIKWGVLLAQAPSMLALLAVAAMVILLNAASIEIASRTDIDLDAELKSNGMANVFAAPLGGLVGCITLSRSLLNFTAGATSRISGMVAALLCAVVLLAGASLLNFFPRPVLGGLLLYLGLSLIIEWVYDGWRRLSRFDYALVLIIVVIIAIFGFVPGVGVGIMAATILFVFNYSRINVVKTELTGAVYHSNVQRSFNEQKLLMDCGNEIVILRLQGYIFFGTAYTLLVHVRGLMSAEAAIPARHVILDFKFVSGIDSSSVLIFSKMRQFAEANDGCLIFVHLQDEVRAMLTEEGLLLPESRNCRIFSDMDYSIEWCEDELLQAHSSTAGAESRTLEEHLAALFPQPAMIPDLMRYLERMEAPSGYTLFREGMAADDLYFVETGTVTAYLELPDGARKRLRTMGPGTVVGEMGLYLNVARSASVCTERPSVLYRLRAASLSRMEQDDAALASAFHRFIVRLVAYRLMHANEELQLLS